MKNLISAVLRLAVAAEENRYRVAWKSTITGESGHGNWTSKSHAQAAVSQGNKEFPEINH